MKLTSPLLVLGLVVLGLAQAQIDDEEPVAEEEHVELFTTPTTKMAAATSDFGYNLFRALANREASTNIFLAPISVSAVLTQLSMGGSEQAQRQLYRALRYHTLQDPQLHNTLRDLLTSVRAAGKGLSSAARIYLARRLRLKQDFFTLVEQQYGVRPKTLQGGSRDTKDINDWVAQETGGTVQRFLTKPLPRNAGINTVSAAHFKGKWATAFRQTETLSFQQEGKAPVRVPMMQQDNYPIKMGVDPDLSCTIAQILMQNDVSMFVFLPNDVTFNLTSLEDTLTAEFVQDLSMTLHPAHVSLTLPALKLSFSTDLLPLLTDLGLSDWLANTDLEKISVQPAKLVTVNHKVVMETASEGNQPPPATSATSHLTYRVDRPFLFLIRDEASGALLFIGRVLNPKTLTV
ncbi:pigment epithelium-derived factor [Dunckerocampus dactyliophorus]|uniref:pigment epithelium-derived factor n=1 Tax=Dunckerocampus dactyliophorus TaxID=161453 RepID=UPI0024049909|nr:pigment epithelium-derived factor [Dunckerocampus dactyliophorus]XP_054611598.1 pigment epithelium-derived factor [Dunckerocampus dactyliophorus]XP_054611599.1 pigment epithelium-derived factor [Dunckerocampus dactyliophorus]